MSDKLPSLSAHAKARQEENRALAAALDEKLNVDGSLFAHKVNMGLIKSDSGVAKLVPSYVSVLTLDEISSKVMMGSDMPFMKNKFDKKTSKLVVDEENINQIMQRAPDWTRQINIAAYLLSNPYHKFTSVLAVIEPDWINDPTHNNWGDDKRALVNSIEKLSVCPGLISADEDGYNRAPITFISTTEAHSFSPSVIKINSSRSSPWMAAGEIVILKSPEYIVSSGAISP